MDKLAKYVTAIEDDDEPVMDSHIPELIMLLFYGDIYSNYIEEKTQEKNPDDHILKTMFRIVRVNNQHLEDFVNNHLQPILTSGLKPLFSRAFKQPATHAGIFLRIDAFRNAFVRLPASKMRKVFLNSRDYLNINKCVDASLIEDEKQAMEELKHIVIKSPQIRTLVSHMYETISKNKFETPISKVDVSHETDELSKVMHEKAHTTVNTPEHKELQKKEEKIKQDIKEVTNATTDKDEPATKADAVEIASQVNAQNQPVKAFTHHDPDPEQRDAIFTSGRVLVVASAGSGKTATLTTKVGYLIKDKNVDPSTIFVTTFSQAASKEMNERIKKQVGEYPDMFVGTMHSFGLKMLETHGASIYKQAIQNNRNRKAVNKFNLDRLTAMAIEEWNSTHNVEFELKTKQTNLAIANWKYDLIEPDMVDEYLQKTKNNYDPEEYITLQNVAQVYKITETLKGRYKITGAKPYYTSTSKKWTEKQTYAGNTPVINFDDMLCDFLKLLKENPKVKEMLQNKFKHFVMDEAQDSNNAQMEIFKLLTEKVDDSGDAWLVGDDNQAIYGFRNSRPELFKQLANDPDWKVRKISTNYRCASKIVDVANNMVANNKNRIPVVAIASRKTEGVVEVHRSSIENLANTSIEDIVNTLEVDSTKKPNDFSVIARTNNEVNDFEAACIIENVPYTRRGGLNFFNRREIKMILNYMVLAISNDVKETNSAFLEIYDYPNRFLGGKFVANIKQYNNYLDALIDNSFLNNFEHYKVSTIKKLHSDIMKLKTSASTKTTPELLEDILSLSGAKESIRSFIDVMAQDEESEEEQQEHVQLGGVSYLVKMMQKDSRFPDIDPSQPKQFLEKATKMKELMKTLNVENGGVVLSTIHASKGLQYYKVFAVMKPPVEKFIKSLDQYEEERRMAYVQLTRAQDELIILSSKYDAKGNNIPVSPFITETGLNPEEFKTASENQETIRKTSMAINRVLTGVK